MSSIVSKITPEALAERIVTAVTVHGFENDKDAASVLQREQASIAKILARYVEPRQVPRVVQSLHGITPPETITFTGLNASANFDEVLSISQDYPLVEWGVLVGEFNSPRFPHPDWVAATTVLCKTHGIRLAAHVCGIWAETALHTPAVLERCLPLHLGAISRIQINAQSTSADTNALSAWSVKNGISVILQWTGDEFPSDRNVLWLADQSRGNGVARVNWPEPVGERLFGFAGGIGPNNVADVVRALGQTPGRYWIDMESSLFDEGKFIAARARTVCERVFGPSPNEVPRLRDALLRVATELGIVRQYAKDLGLNEDADGSALYSKLSSVDAHIAQALGHKTILDAAIERFTVEPDHVVGEDVNYLPAGAVPEEVAEKIASQREVTYALR